MRLNLLGGFDLSFNGKAVPLPMSSQRLLAFLALHERALSRPYVAGSLWPDASDDHAAGNLRSTLWRLGHAPCPLVVVASGSIRLAPHVIVDLGESVSLAHRVLDGSIGLDEADSALVALSSPLLPDWSDEWVVIERERFSQLRLHALESLCERLTAAGRFSQAIEAGLGALEGDPLRESAYRALMKAYLAEGNTAQAIVTYVACCRVLCDELGLTPSSGIRELARDLKASALG